MKIKRYIFFIFFFISIFFFLSASDEDIFIEAIIDPSTIYVNEEFKIIVTIISNKPIDIQELPSFENFKYIKQTKEIEIEENFQASYLTNKIFVKYTKVITFYLIAEQEENILGTSLKFKINNNYHVLKDFFIPIISATNIFEDYTTQSILSFTYEPKEIYQGQPFTCEWTIYSNQIIDKVIIVKLPEIIGALYQKIEVQNPKDTILLFDKQINKYSVLKLLVFPTSSKTIFFDKIEISVQYMIDDKIKESIITFPQKKIEINPIPINKTGYFGLIGEYSISYTYKRIEDKNSLLYLLEIVFIGNGNHKYVDFNKLNFKQENFNIIGPYISKEESKVVLDYYLYPKQNGFLYLNQIIISFFNPVKKDFENIIIPKSSVYVNPNLDQIINKFNFNYSENQFIFNKYTNIFDYIETLSFNTFYLFTFFILFSILIIVMVIKIIKIQFNNSENFNDKYDIISLWQKFYISRSFNSNNDLENFIKKQDKKTQYLLHNIYSIYNSFFNKEYLELNLKKQKKLIVKFAKFLNENKKERR